MNNHHRNLTRYPSNQVSDKGLEVKIEFLEGNRLDTIIRKGDFCIAGPSSP